MKPVKEIIPELNSVQNRRETALDRVGAELPSFRFEACRPDPARRRIGWFCSYTPEELIMAAGFVPYRLGADIGGVEDHMDFLPPNLCPYVRKFLAAALAGHYRDLAGIVFVYSCDAMRRLADIWTTYDAPGFYYCLDVPRRSDLAAELFLMEQLQEFKSFLVRQAKREISNPDIHRAIQTVNHTRSLMERISRLRRHGAPVLQGSMFHAIARCGMQADKARFNIEAEHFLHRLESLSVGGAKRTGVAKPRVLLSGCVVDGTALPEFIEGCGCTIVADDHCTGARHYSGRMNDAMDPLRAIAWRYLQRPACARMTGAAARIRRVLSLARKYRVDGVIFQTLKFCDPVQADLPRLSETLQREGIPLLPIDLENSDTAGGQIKTRVEAFVELLKGHEPDER